MSSLDPIVLFFVLGVLASWFKSDLEIPDQVSKSLSIFLLLSLGLKGGHQVREAEALLSFLPTLAVGFGSCLLLPVGLFFLLRPRLGAHDAAALAASYGSVSAVTFIAAESVIKNLDISSSGYMVAVMALMEIPAIIVALSIYQKSSSKNKNSRSIWLHILSMKSVILLIGGFLIGLTMNTQSWLSIAPVVQGGFKGVLAFFLLDLGILAQKQLQYAWRNKWIGLVIAFVIPVFFGVLSLLAAAYMGLPQGDQILLAVLAGSASYIAAPAAVRTAIPEASPSLYLALPLALTFPMNLLFGIPLYIHLSSMVL
jgi:hypothetical protein